MKNYNRYLFTKKTIISLLFLSFTSLSFGQSRNEISIQNSIGFLCLSTDGSLKRKILNETDIDGSPYLNKEFISGNIFTKNKIQYVGVPLRYNIYNDEMEFKTDTENYLAISDPKSMKEIRIGGAVFVYDIKRNKKGEQEGYYELLQDGNVRLLSRYNIVFKPITSTTGYKQSQPPRLNRNANTYYIKTGSSEPLLLASKKDLDVIFGSKNDKLLAFIKSRKLNVKKEEDLIKLVEFINQME